MTILLFRFLFSFPLPVCKAIHERKKIGFKRYNQLEFVSEWKKIGIPIEAHQFKLGMLIENRKSGFGFKTEIGFSLLETEFRIYFFKFFYLWKIA